MESLSCLVLMPKESYYLDFFSLLNLYESGTGSSQIIVLSQFLLASLLLRVWYEGILKYRVISVSLRFSTLGSLIQGYVEVTHYLSLSQSVALSPYVFLPRAAWHKAKRQSDMKPNSCLPPVSAGLPRRSKNFALYAFSFI